MICALYARVSSKEQECEGFSIPAQLKLLRQYALENGMTIDEEFVDVETAKQSGRINFGRMVQKLETANPPRIILVEKTDRLYRNIKDWVTIDDLEPKIHFVRENATLSKESRSSEKFMHGIKVLVAKNYVDNLSEEVRKGLTEKAAQGEWPSRAPVGYVNNRDTHRIEPDPEKGPFVRKLFEQYATGNYSLADLARLAKESGLFSRNSQAINKAGIHRILKNPIYYGEFVWKGERYVGTHTPLISKGLFDEVEVVFKRSNRPKQTKRGFPFSGLVKCGRCGCSMTPEIKKGRYVYYHCTQHLGPCDNVYIREEALADLLGEALQRITIGESEVADIKKALLESQRDHVEYRDSKLKSLRKRQDRLQSLLDCAYEDKLDGTISEELWRRKSSSWQTEINDIRIRMKALDSAAIDFYETGSQILELAKSAYDMYLRQDSQERRLLLNSVLSNCTFYRGSLCPTYKKPFDILAEGASYESKRG